MGSNLKGPSLGGSLFRPARRGRDGDPGAAPGGGDVFFAAMMAAPTPMVLSDPKRPDNPIVFANPAFLRMTGYDRAEVVGRNCRFLQGPESDPGTVDAIRRAVLARTEVAVELLNHRKDGTPFRNALFVAPLFDAAGDLVHFFACQCDVSRRHDAEGVLPRAGQSGSPAPTSAVSRSVGDVAHDINNMLQVVAGHMESLKDHAAASGDARLVRRTRAVSEAADRAAALTLELLAGSPARKAGSAAAPVAAAPAGGETARPEPAAARGGQRVLVVDDRAEVAELARTMLESAGYAVEVAGGGQDALDKLRGGFDLLFSDLVMPGGLDGASLAREAQRRDPRLKVLLTTGRSGPGLAAGEPDGTGFETIAKPYRRSELVGTVRRLLDRPAEAG